MSRCKVTSNEHRENWTLRALKWTKKKNKKLHLGFKRQKHKGFGFERYEEKSKFKPWHSNARIAKDLGFER